MACCQVGLLILPPAVNWSGPLLVPHMKLWTGQSLIVQRFMAAIPPQRLSGVKGSTLAKWRPATFGGLNFLVGLWQVPARQGEDLQTFLEEMPADHCTPMILPVTVRVVL
eukprot:s6469_g3.t1